MDSKKASLLEEKIQSLNDSLMRRNHERQEMQSLIASLKDQNETIESHLSMSRESYNALQVFYNQLKTEKENIQNKLKQAEFVVVSESGETKTVNQLVSEYRELLKKTSIAATHPKPEHDHLNSTSNSMRSNHQPQEYARESSISRKGTLEDGLPEAIMIEISTLKKQKEALEKESTELQEKLDEAVDKIFQLEASKVGDLTMDGDLLTHNWSKLEHLLRDKAEMDVPECSE